MVAVEYQEGWVERFYTLGEGSVDSLIECGMMEEEEEEQWVREVDGLIERAVVGLRL
jgi:hypothetical protein